MDCAICLEPIDILDRNATTECRHTFHTRCMRTLARYARYDLRCPLCRTTLCDELDHRPGAVLISKLCVVFSMYAFFVAVIYPINYFAMYHSCSSIGRFNDQLVCYVLKK